MVFEARILFRVSKLSKKLSYKFDTHHDNILLVSSYLS